MDGRSELYGMAFGVGWVTLSRVAKAINRETSVCSTSGRN